MKPRSAVILLFAMMLFYEVSAGQKYSSSHARDVTGNAATSLGLRALNRIMSGARKISPADVNPREYVKRGGAVSALDDFYAALPNNMRYTQEPNKVFVQKGYIGDRTLVVRRGESIKPTLTIFKTDEANDPTALRHVITYTRNEKLLHAPRTDLDMIDW